MPATLHNIGGLLTSATEVRLMVYSEVFQVSSSSLAWAREYEGRPTLTEPGNVPALPLLQTCRAFSREAANVLYSERRFVVRNHVPSSSRIAMMNDLSLFFAAAQFETQPSGTVEFGQRFRQKLIRDVARTFKPTRDQLPLWLFGGYYIRCDPFSGRSAEGNPRSGLGPFPGFVFPAFLRQIGPSNTETIVKLDFTFSNLSQAYHDFSIYAEIVRQHIPKLVDLSICKFSISSLPPSWCATATKYLNLRERSLRLALTSALNLGIECAECHGGVHNHNSFDTDAWNQQPDGYGVTFLSEIRLLLKDLPNFWNLELTYDCEWLDGEFEAVGAMLEDEKLKGITFDLHEAWRSLDEKLKNY
ncbi:hypothetical protein MMC22_005204 [Lobaria immixta]|nr:hypothetical protein [Lobaria immixta]